MSWTSGVVDQGQFTEIWQDSNSSHAAGVFHQHPVSVSMLKVTNTSLMPEYYTAVRSGIASDRTTDDAVTKMCSGEKSVQLFEVAEWQYDQWINNKRQERENLYSVITGGVTRVNTLTKEHFLLVQDADGKGKTAEEQINIILQDIMIFPELYTHVPDRQLAPFLDLLDETGFRVYFTSARTANPFVKAHGSLDIAHPSLAKGISVSGAGDPGRIKLRLSEQLRNALINYFSLTDSRLPDDGVNRFADSTEEIATIFAEQYRNGRWKHTDFDAKALDMLLASLPVSPDKKALQDLLEKDIFTYRLNTQVNARFQEMWTKARLAQQEKDTTRFNQEYPHFLKTAERSRASVMFGHLHHSLSKKIAIREQKVKPSEVVKNWLHFEKAKAESDNNRSLVYQYQHSWIYGGGLYAIMNNKRGNCNTMAAALLGRKPDNVASVANIAGTSKATHVMTPMKIKEIMSKIRNFKPEETGNPGVLTARTKIYDPEHLNVVARVKNGCAVVYDDSIQDAFEQGRTQKTDYVWGAVITNSSHRLLSQEKWLYGWIPRANIDSIGSDTRTVQSIVNVPGAEKQNPIADPRKDHYPHVEYSQPFDRDRYELNADAEDVFKEGQQFPLGSHIASIKEGKINWNNQTFALTDYKGHAIVIPDEKMYAWLEQRRIFKINLESAKDIVSRTVVFGTHDDRYAMYPDKYGTMSRRAVKEEASWLPAFDERKRRLNPPIPGVPKFVRKQFILPTQKRLNEIHEKSGLQIENAPHILMKHSYLKTHDDFIYAYLSGSKGKEGQEGLAEGVSVSGADHITDHEIYRLFTCANRASQLNATCFADDHLLIEAPTRQDNHWYNKNQITRAYRHRVGIAKIK